MPQKPSVYRSFVTCSDPEGVVNCGAVRKERRNMPKSMDMSCTSKRLKEEGVGNMRNSSSQLEEIEKGAHKLNKMIDSWASGMSIDGQPKDIAQDLLRGALDLQESLNMLSKLQEASLYMAKLKRLEMHDEKARVSLDESPKNKCIDEIMKVIRDGPVNQNMLAVSYGESRWDRRGISCASEGHSISSGQSSVNFSKKVCSTDHSSVSSDTSDMKCKRPNLIAKLMGLDDRKPSTDVQNEKRVPSFEIDAAELRNTQVSTQMRCQEKKTLRELLAATESKEDLESKYVNRLIPVLDLLPRTAPKNQNEANKFPPIVLMKPMRTPYKESERRQEHCFDASEIVKELKAKNWFSHVHAQVSESGSVMKNEKSIMRKPRILTPETTKHTISAVAKQQSCKIKTKEKAVVSVEQTSRANKIPKILKSPDVSDNVKKVAKNARGTKLLVSKETLVDLPKANNQDKKLRIIKPQSSIPRKVPQNTNSKYAKETSKDHSVRMKTTKKRNGKLVTLPLPGDALRHETDTAAVDLPCQGLKDDTTVETAIEEKWKDVEIMHETSKQEQSNKHYEDVNCEKVKSNTSWLKSRSCQQDLLLSSPSLSAFMEVFFHLDPSSTTSAAVKPSIYIDADASLFISYAKEVLERRSKQLLFSPTSTRIPVTMNLLFEEVCDAYEAIDSYKDGRPAVDIFDMLEKDMKCKEVVSSVWNMGWKNECSSAETEQIVANLEKLILKDFIDEIFVN